MWILTWSWGLLFLMNKKHTGPYLQTLVSLHALVILHTSINMVLTVPVVSDILHWRLCLNVLQKSHWIHLTWPCLITLVLLNSGITNSLVTVLSVKKLRLSCTIACSLNLGIIHLVQATFWDAMVLIMSLGCTTDNLNLSLTRSSSRPPTDLKKKLNARKLYIDTFIAACQASTCVNGWGSSASRVGEVACPSYTQEDEADEVATSWSTV